MFKEIVIILLVSIGCYSATLSQTKKNNYPKIGQPFPDLKFTDVQHYASKQLKISDLKGQWILLDFWNRFCSSCIKEFPKFDSLQKEFDGKVKVILVGYNGSQLNRGLSSDNIHIQNLYETVRKREQLSLTSVYDSTAFHQLGIYAGVKLVIDPDGIVRAVTERISRNDMKTFLRGQEPKFAKFWLIDENQVKYDPKLPFLLNGNGGNDNDFLYRSVLSEFKDYMAVDNHVEYLIEENKLQVIGTDLASLYRFAYIGAGYINYGNALYGEFEHHPILELRDKSPFKVDSYFRTGMYAYSVAFPPSKNNKESVMKFVRSDLQNYFGYQVAVEKRQMPIWKLVTIEKRQSPSKLIEGIISYPIESTYDLLYYIAGNANHKEPFIDATGIKGKINFTFSANLDDLQDIRRALRENGFDLIKGEKEMQVVVIRDNPSEIN